MDQPIELRSSVNGNLVIRAYHGHFATNHSHINYYMDMSRMKHDHKMAKEAAITLAKPYIDTTSVDAVVTMEGCEVIGAFLARKLAKEDIRSVNQGKNIYVISPEYNTNNQLIFRDNVQDMIREKNVLLLLASVTTGKTIKRAMECIQYYGGTVAGISAIFSAVDQVNGVSVSALFHSEDIPHYITYSGRDCPKCKKGIKLDALVNWNGFTKL